MLIFSISLLNVVGFFIWLLNKRNFSRKVVDATKGVLICLKDKGEFQLCNQILRRYKKNINEKSYKELEEVMSGEPTYITKPSFRNSVNDGK